VGKSIELEAALVAVDSLLAESADKEIQRIKRG
jgi:hypothetical protein